MESIYQVPLHLKNRVKQIGYDEIDRNKKLKFWKTLALIGWLLFFIVLYCWLWFPDLEASEPNRNCLKICIEGYICPDTNCLNVISDCEKYCKAQSKTSLEAQEEICLECIIQIESNNNPYAYNSNSQARGLMQITPICLYEYNNYHREGRIITEEQLFDSVYNLVVGKWYINIRIPEMLKAYNIPDTIEHRLISFNWGIGHFVKWYRVTGAKWNKLPKETQRYLKLYKQYANRNMYKN